MKLKFVFFLFITLISVSHNSVASSQLNAAKTIIEAVNTKDPQLYVSVFSENVEIFVEGELRLKGKQSLFENRDNHLKSHPNAYADIQHLVEIDNKVIMHDRAYLDKEKSEGRDIVEIFTFDDSEKIVRVDVIQARDLFSDK